MPIHTTSTCVPGVDIVEDLGGLHGFMQWHGATLTDSGGFQGFSLEHLRKITEEAIIFRSHIDGSEHTFSPEAATQHQEKIGADIIMPLDICAPADSDFEAVDAAVDKTNRWLLRCVEAHTRTDQRLFGIVQGGLFPELRRKSAEFITGIGFPGYSIGGLSVGEPKQAMYDTVELTTPMLPADAPRYLMGVGSPERPGGMRGAWYRYVRLRAAHANSAQRFAVREDRTTEYHRGVQ